MWIRVKVLIRTSDAERWRWFEQVLSDVPCLWTVTRDSVSKGYRPASNKMQCNTCDRGITWSADSTISEIFVGGVNVGLLGSGLISLRLSSYGRASSRVISPSRSARTDASHHRCKSCISSLTEIGRSAVFPYWPRHVMAPHAFLPPQLGKLT